jgi:hypothetical protein
MFSLRKTQTQTRLPLAAQPPAGVALTEKYRPATFTQVLGQAAAVRAMTAFVAAPSNAVFLFHGKTGVGKSSLALALAAELGALDMGGLTIIKSGMGDGETVQASLDSLRYTPMLGSGWKVIIVDEADAMSPKAKQIWLSALEDLPNKSVIVFTTNNVSRFDDRFLDRCRQIEFQADAARHKGDAQALVLRVWTGETGSAAGAPRLSRLGLALDGDGNLSYRRVIRSLEPVLLARPASTVPSVSVRRAGGKMAAYDNYCDWQAIAQRFLAGEPLTALARELQLETRIVDYHVTRTGGTNAARNSRRSGQAQAS